MSKGPLPQALLDEFYQDYLVDQDRPALIKKVSERYTMGTLHRLTTVARRVTRRAAVLAIGFIADNESTPILGKAMLDEDRLVRCLAENGIRGLWIRAGGEAERQLLHVLIRLNSSQQFKEAARQAGELIRQAPLLAEAWNQRAIAHYGLARYRDSIADCRRVLELNPFHFGAAGGMGQCQVQLGDMRSALESFRTALRLNPNLEGIRANVTYLERSLKRH